MSTPKLNSSARHSLGARIKKRMLEKGETPDTLCAKVNKLTGHTPRYTDIMALYQGTAGLATLPWSLALYTLGYATDADMKVPVAKEKAVAKAPTPRTRTRPNRLAKPGVVDE